MSRNSVDYFSNIPTPTMPRYKRDLGVHNKKLTFQHGKLIPWYTRLVYPHSNLKMDMSCFVRMDTSVKVPLDNIYLDNYFFFVPLRILLGNERFEKILGHKTAYDNNVYNFPMIHTDRDSTDASHQATFFMDHNSLIQYMNYGACTQSDVQYSYMYSVDKTGNIWKYTNDSTTEVLNALNLAAYYKVYNEYFRDENLDPEFPIDDLLAGDVYLSDLQLANSMWDVFRVLPVNRYHDIFSSGLISPVKGGSGDVYIPLGFSVLPVVTEANSHNWLSPEPMKFIDTSTGDIAKGDGNIYTLGYGSGPGSNATLRGLTGTGTSSTQLAPSNLIADASAATGPSVRQLYNSLALFSLYDKRGTFGTRLIEQIRGSFGLEVPDGLLDRAEYLGGSNQSLNNIPVLNTADDLGTMRGNSATITGLNSFDKGFNEWGIVIGLTCTRVKHTYGQGILDPTWMLYDNLDLYWPEFANIGKVESRKRRLFNIGSVDTSVFNYVEPHIDLDVDIDSVGGDFGAFRSESDDLVNYWTYQDIYSASPIFNATWLKEQSSRIAGTLTGNLIPGATKSDGHQFMIRYNWHAQFTVAKPLHSSAPNITGRI